MVSLLSGGTSVSTGTGGCGLHSWIMVPPLLLWNALAETQSSGGHRLVFRGDQFRNDANTDVIVAV